MVKFEIALVASAALQASAKLTWNFGEPSGSKLLQPANDNAQIFASGTAGGSVKFTGEESGGGFVASGEESGGGFVGIREDEHSTFGEESGGGFVGIMGEQHGGGFEVQDYWGVGNGYTAGDLPIELDDLDLDSHWGVGNGYVSSPLGAAGGYAQGHWGVGNGYTAGGSVGGSSGVTQAHWGVGNGYTAGGSVGGSSGVTQAHWGVGNGYTSENAARLAAQNSGSFSYFRTASQLPSRKSDELYFSQPRHRVVSADPNRLRETFAQLSNGETGVLGLPLADGTSILFQVSVSKFPSLSQKHQSMKPDMVQFDGVATGAVDNGGVNSLVKGETVTVSGSYSPKLGVRASITSSVRGAMYIDQATTFEIEQHAKILGITDVQNSKGSVFKVYNFAYAASASLAGNGSGVQKGNGSGVQKGNGSGVQKGQESGGGSIVTPRTLKRVQVPQPVARGMCTIGLPGISVTCNPFANTEECAYDAGSCCGGYSTCEDASGDCTCEDPAHGVVQIRKYRIAIGTTQRFVQGFSFDRDAAFEEIAAQLQRANSVLASELGIVLELVPGTESLFGAFDTLSDEPQVANHTTYFDDVINPSQALNATKSALQDDSYDLLLGVYAASVPNYKDVDMDSARNFPACGSKDIQPGSLGFNFDNNGRTFTRNLIVSIARSFGATTTTAGCQNRPFPGGELFDALFDIKDTGAVEQGMGSTLLSSFPELCSDEERSRPALLPLFHSASLQQVRRFVRDSKRGGSCGSALFTLTRPVVEPSLGYGQYPNRTLTCTIPISTPFRLESIGGFSNGEGQSALKTWEQSNVNYAPVRGIQKQPNVPNSNLFNVTVPRDRYTLHRYFPLLEDQQNATAGVSYNSLPSIDTSLHFVLSARSLIQGFSGAPSGTIGSSYVSEEVTVHTNSSYDPLRITSFSKMFGADSNSTMMRITWSGGIPNEQVRVAFSMFDQWYSAVDSGFGYASSRTFAVEDGVAEIPFSEIFGCYEDREYVRVQAMVESVIDVDGNQRDGCRYFDVSDNYITGECVHGGVLEPTIAPTTAPTDFDSTANSTDFNSTCTKFPNGTRESFDLHYQGTFSSSGPWSNATCGYNNNIELQFVIHALQDRDVYVNFPYFSTENGYDYVRVFDGNGRNLGSYSGDLTFGVRTHNSSLMNITFTTDGSVTRDGFLAVFQSVPRVELPGSNNNYTTPGNNSTEEVIHEEFEFEVNHCSTTGNRCFLTEAGNFTSDSSIFENYRNNYNSTIVLSANWWENKRPAIKFFREMFSTEANYDRVRVFDDHNLLAEFHGQYRDNLPTIVSPDLRSKLYVEFSSDYSVTDLGYFAEMFYVHDHNNVSDPEFPSYLFGGIVTNAPTGTFTASPTPSEEYFVTEETVYNSGEYEMQFTNNTHSLNQRHIFNFDADSFYAIVTVTGSERIWNNVNMYEHHRNETTDTSSEEVVGRYNQVECEMYRNDNFVIGNHTDIPPCSFVSTSGVFSFRYYNRYRDNAVVYVEIVLVPKPFARSADDLEVLLDPIEMRFTNTGYDDRQMSAWPLRVEAGNKVKLTFESFDLEESYDFVYVYDGSSTAAPLLGQYSGSEVPLPIVSSAENMLVVFSSDFSNNGLGFKATPSRLNSSDGGSNVLLIVLLAVGSVLLVAGTVVGVRKYRSNTAAAHDAAELSMISSMEGAQLEKPQSLSSDNPIFMQANNSMPNN